MRVLLVTATAALSALAVWFVGAGASASASEIPPASEAFPASEASPDAAGLLASPAGPIDGAGNVDRGENVDRGGAAAPDPIAAAVRGLDETTAEGGATSGKAAPAPASAAPVDPPAPTDPPASHPPASGSARSAPEPSASAVEQIGDELPGSPVEHVLHQARPALEPVDRAAGAVGAAVGGGSAPDDPVSAALPEVRGDDVVNSLSPLWTDEGSALPAPDAHLPSSGEKAEPGTARGDTTSMPPRSALPHQLRHDQRSAASAPEKSRHAGKSKTDGSVADALDAHPLLVDALDAHPKTEHNAIGAFVDGGNQAGFAVGWYPVASPLDGSAPSERIPDEYRVRSGTSAPQPGTTPD